MQNSLYEIQHFGYSAQQLTLERKHLLRNLLNDCFKSLIQKSTKVETTAKLLRSREQEITQNIFKLFEDDFKELATLDQLYFKIPNHVLLPCDFIHKQCTENTQDTEKKLDEDIENLKKIYLENSVMASSLEAEEAQFNALWPYIERYQETRSKVVEGIDVLNQNKTSKMKTLIRATKHIIDKTKD